MASLRDNILSLGVVHATSYLLPLLTLPFLVRTLGAESFGKLSFSLALIQYLVIVTEYGFNLSATRSIAQNQSDIAFISRVFWSVTTSKLILASISFAALSIFLELSGTEISLKIILYACCFMLAGNVMFPIWLFQGKERLDLVPIVSLLPRVTAIAAIFFFVEDANDHWIAASIQGLASVAEGAIALALVWRLRWVNWVLIRNEDISFRFSEGWHLFLSSAAISLYATSSTAILGIFSGFTTAGYFSAADKIRKAAQNIFFPISQALFPRISSVIIIDKAMALRLIKKTMLLQGIATLLISGVLGILAADITRLVYGSENDAVAMILKILSPIPFFVGISNVLGIQTMLALGMSKGFSEVVLLACACYLLVIFPLCFFFQASGAAVAVLITEILVVAGMGLKLARSKPFSP